ncbi:MAG: hypothetical protein HZB56_10765 [Deltaproteobacteria bacterium]|nr:hypothetical protein [Deltaproteobacteria bacterium]
MRWPRVQTVVGVVLSAAVTLYGAKAAAFLDIGGNALLADLLANATKQLAVATQSLALLRRSYAEARKVADYAEEAAEAARSFQRVASTRLGDRFLADLDAAGPDLARYRRDALGAAGMSGSDWASGTGTLRGLSTYCLGGAGQGRTGCVKLGNELAAEKVLAALGSTFGRPGTLGALEAGAVDAEVAAAIQGDAAQARLASLQKARVRELLRRCNSASPVATARQAKRVAEECRAAAEQAQLLHLEEGQETNAKLSQLARLQAVGVEQKNGDLKRELTEQAARRAGLTAGLDDLARQRVSIKSGGLEF